MTTKNSLLNKRRLAVGSYVVDVYENDVSLQRQTIIFVHGIGVSGAYFLPLANQLATRYHVVVVDLPGYGKTPKPDHALSIAELADFIISFSNHLQVVNPIILGHSMGCQIIAHAVKKAPAQYSKTILLAPTVYKNERRLIMQTVRLLQDTMHEPIRASCVIFPDYIRMGMGRYLTTSRYMLADRIEDNLPHCVVPALIIRGTKDKIVPDEWATHLDQLTPNSMLRHVNNAPHALQLGQPKIVAEMCKDFIEG